MTTTQAATGPVERNALPLVGADGRSPAQFRISQVQILNWGAYSGLQTMSVAQSGTAIIGPAGRGKSTLLDAMASVILPLQMPLQPQISASGGNAATAAIGSVAAPP